MKYLIEACLRQRFLVVMATLLAVGWGLYVTPFSWTMNIERDPVPVDAIPDIGENQQIVFTEWPGRSPQDIEDQITYPLTSELLGIPKVKTVRSSSMDGFSSIYVIFEEDAEFYWTRARVNEKLSSIGAGTLPDGVQPRLGPDATALGQIFWYTLEGRDADGNRVGGWDDDELRALQDFTIRQALSSAGGVSEVASIGGKVREYHVDVDPNAMRAFDVSMDEILAAVSASNAEVGARTTELNGVEYMIRGLGFVKDVDDIEQAVIRTVDGAPVVVGDVAHVELGPGLRRGTLTRSGVDSVGAVVTARYGANPREVIDNVKDAIDNVQQGLPERVLEDGTVSQVTIVPFYDRTELIERTLGTLSSALYQQILITVLVILLLMLHVRTSVVVSGLLPLAVLITFVAMKYTGVDANVVALAGIAIAIGTMVDMAIIMTENISQHLEDESLGGGDRMERVARGAAEVAPAIVTAMATTIISFLPVFMLTGQEGKLFTPLAFTKTYALVASLFIAVLVIPVVASSVLGNIMPSTRARQIVGAILAAASAAVAIFFHAVIGIALLIASISWVAATSVRDRPKDGLHWDDELAWLLRGIGLASIITGVAWLLTLSWMPLGEGPGRLRNLIFVFAIVGGLLAFFWLFRLAYPRILRWILAHKRIFLPVPAIVVMMGVTIWLGFGQVFSWMPDRFHQSPVGQWLHHEVSGLDREFMPHLDEGAFLYMPSTMPHGSFGEALAMVQQLDLLFETVPEVEYSVGKIGRADSPLDPAPVGMVETIVQYLPEYEHDDRGRRLRFAVDEDGEFLRDGDGELIADEKGLPYRNWRPEIQRSQDIWDELVDVARDVPGLTSAPLLQPISTRVVMLQSGIRAPMAVQLQGPNLDDLGDAALQIQEALRAHPMVASGAVNADRPMGKPYLEIHPSRRDLARHGITMEHFQRTVQATIGGIQVAETVEGRERFGVRVRYPRELRDSPEQIKDILVATGEGASIPLGDLASIEYVRGPEMIRSEDSALITYVMFDGLAGYGEVDVVSSVDEMLAEMLARRELEFADGVRYGLTGNFENSIRAEQRLKILIPLILIIILGLLYLQFRSIWTALAIFSGIAVAFGGGFILLWLYDQAWFLDLTILGAHLRDVFQVGTINLSVAVWVGFIALFGIAADDGIVMSTYLKQRFEKVSPDSVTDVRDRVVEAGLRRIRPVLMTTATTVLALLPILTSYGTGADVMIPMAIPVVGGMMIALLTLFVVPVLYSVIEETKLKVRA
ncbi:MAG: efflux RND transporter permease subunit [Bradymonadaceae bacterium]